MNRGRENISDSVPAFPAHCTSIRRAPAAARARTPTDTRTSRTRRRTPTTAGTLPSMRRETTTVPRRIRSAVGSRTLPSSLTWWSRRAR
jgi:hypothetical protein